MKNQINVQINVNPDVVIGILINLSCSGVLRSYLDKEPKRLGATFRKTMQQDPSKWTHFKWVLTYCDKKYYVTFNRIILALQKMAEDKANGKYFNKWHDPLTVATGGDFGDYIFDMEVIEYVCFGKIIWA